MATHTPNMGWGRSYGRAASGPDPVHPGIGAQPYDGLEHARDDEDVHGRGIHPGNPAGE